MLRDPLSNRDVDDDKVPAGIFDRLPAKERSGREKLRLELAADLVRERTARSCARRHSKYLRERHQTLHCENAKLGTRGNQAAPAYHIGNVEHANQGHRAGTGRVGSGIDDALTARGDKNKIVVRPRTAIARPAADCHALAALAKWWQELRENAL